MATPIASEHKGRYDFLRGELYRVDVEIEKGARLDDLRLRRVEITAEIAKMKVDLGFPEIDDFNFWRLLTLATRFEKNFDVWRRQALTTDRSKLT